MRMSVFLGIFGLLAWVFLGMPVPVVQDKPVMSDASFQNATFQHVDPNSGQRQKMVEAIDNGRVAQDPRRRELREAVLHQAERLAQWPCSEIEGRDLAQAAIPFLEAMAEGPSETENVSIDGTIYNASELLDEPARLALSKATMSGQIKDGEIPGHLMARGMLIPGSVMGADTQATLLRMAGCTS